MISVKAIGESLVEITRPNLVLRQIVGEIFSHPLGQRGDKHPLVLLARLRISQQIIHLPVWVYLPDQHPIRRITC